MDKTIEKYCLIIGFEVTGRAALRYLLHLNKKVVIFDDRKKGVQLKEGECLSQEELYARYSPDQFEMAIVSPGIAPTHPLFSWISQSRCRITSELEIALDQLYVISQRKEKKIRLLAVTGTNGKTTTVELTTHLLLYAGVAASAFGNIGVPLLEHVVDLLEQQEKKLYEVYVLELSSYQIERIKKPAFHAAVCLNITPDHLDWHGSFDAYKKAKMGLFSLLLPESQAALHISIDPFSIENRSRSLIRYGVVDRNEVKKKSIELYASDDGQLSFHSTHAPLLDMPLPKKLCSSSAPKHDIENFLAAFFLIQSSGITYEKIVLGYDSFQKGDHRFQLFARYNSPSSTINIINDSKATNIYATIEAVQAVQNSPIILLAGGVHKGYPYDEWKRLFPQKVFLIVAIGEAKKQIEEELHEVVPVRAVYNLREAVSSAIEYAYELSKSFSVVTVLLSPGCASFDMFSGYADRGAQFQNEVCAYFKNKNVALDFV